MSQKVAYLFAGQGAQYVGMGKDLYAAFLESKTVFDKADKVLGFSLSKLCFGGPQAELTQTQNCQPAILVTSIAAWEAFKSVRSSEFGVGSYAAGLSLGEYSALVAAGAINLEDAVYLARKRGEFMEEEALKSPGKMASVLGLDLTIIKNICRETKAEIANINCPGQIVVSGGIKEIEKAAKLAEEQGAKRVILLEVSGAFHSSFMQGAALKLAGELEKIKIDTAQIPLVSNVTAKPVTKPEEIKANLIKQITASVLWEDSMKFILSKNVTHFFEFGPGKVLKGLMRRIDETAQVTNIEKKEDILNRASQKCRP
ncbi:MAG: [acyl-carrier-protein] S-malonyltransferase [Candidatus Omnitrophica bacterium CG23_combo_of_CG06-09_8_20_14_all_40_11]|nr:MAG: [acyl-carrier-protein] S-malonyltransferase [Candidatus Omnitrophica bacterium CG23_combo_of_CG06-09_8_20_14_all_40_11]